MLFYRPPPAARLRGRQFIALDRHLFFVAPEELRIVIVGVSLVEVSEPVVEALLVRDSGGAGLAQSPFADYACCVTSLLEQLGYGDICRPQRH